MSSDLNIEQQRAIAMANARKRKAEQMSFGDKAEAFGQTAYNAFTLGAGDEIAAALQTPIYAMRGVENPYEFALERRRQTLSDFQEQEPGAALGANLIGGIGAGVASGALLPKGFKAYAAANPGKAALGAGAASGGVYGFSSGQGGVEERGSQAAQMGAVGGVLGPIGASALKGVAGLTKPVGRLTQKALNRFQKPQATQTAAREIAESVPESVPSVEGQSAALSKIEKALRQDFGDRYDEVLDAYQKGDVSLAELYGPKTRTLAKGAAQYTGGQAPAERFFTRELLEAPERALKSVDENIGSGSNYFAQVEDILEAGRGKASKLYEEAYEGVVENADILQTDEITKALDKAYKQYPSELKNVAPNSIKALDYAKRVLDDDIGKAMRSGEGNFARSRVEIVNQLKQAMDEASPSYAKARAASGDYLSLTKAMDRGKGFMKTDPEILGKEFAKLSNAEKTAFKSGVGKQIRDLIENTNEGANFYNRVFGSTQKQERLAKILNPKQFKQLQSDLKAEDRLFKLRNDVLGNSATTSKAIAAGEIASVATDMANLANGSVINMPKAGFVAALRKMTDGINDKTARQISEIVYEKSPEKKLQIIQSLGKSLTKDEADIAKRVYFEAAEQFDPYRFTGAFSAGALTNGPPTE